MLVDDWSEGVGPYELFIEFLEAVFANISAGDPDSWHGRHLKPVEEVDSLAGPLQESGEREAPRAPDSLSPDWPRA